MSGDKDIDYEALSDEDFMSQVPVQETAMGLDEPEPEPEPEGGFLEDRLEGPAGSQEDGPDGEADASPAPDAEDGAEAAETPEGGDKPTDEGSEAADGEGTADPDSTPHHTTPKQGEEGADGEAPKDGKPAKEGPKSEGEPDYKALYEQVMGSFKANGKEFKPQSPDEAVRLMQMGANYTKKMQALKPNLKLMRMLENKGLLQEEKLNFLIDLDEKNPEAIRKLLQDGKIDPLDLDMSSDAAYKPGNHGISDQEHEFHATLEDVTSTQTGKETVRLINDDWDPASKNAVYEDPNVLRIINEQRSNGIYDTIASEIERRRTLGDLTSVPFLQAYKQVGDDLHAAGKLVPAEAPGSQDTPEPKPQRQVVETRPAAPKKPMANGDKARAAGQAPKAPNSPKPDFNPFTMSDEEIMAATSPKV